MTSLANRPNSAVVVIDAQNGSSRRPIGGMRWVFVAGAQTDACIRSSLHGAFTRGYDTVLVSDAHTTEDLTSWGAPAPDAVIRHTNLYWRHTSAPGRTATAVACDDIEFTD
jgi:hypothetical protein